MKPDKQQATGPAIADLWISDARDVFGHRFRDSWRVRGWDEDQFPPTYYCEVSFGQPPAPAAPSRPATPQLELFA